VSIAVRMTVLNVGTLNKFQDAGLTGNIQDRDNLYEIGSLFSGIGGIELGFERTGAFKTIWFVEKDKYAQQIIRKNWGANAIIYDDITRLDFRTVPKIDVLTGGFPCQDISTAGKGVGITGSRSSLWRYYKKAIRVLRPKIAFVENVSILTGRGLNVVLGDLASIGYDAEWYCVPVSSIGAPHQRDRLFVIAYMQIKGNRGLSIFKRDKGTKDPDIIWKSKIISNPKSQRTVTAQQQRQRNGIISICEDVPDTECDRRGQMEPEDGGRTKNKRTVCKTWKCSDEQRKAGRWSTESGICGVANGVPNRVDRIKCLGNSVVPQVAEVFAEAIKMQLNHSVEG
jgi:DNA (cytosine-5)-methyltransferase 1